MKKILLALVLFCASLSAQQNQKKWDKVTAFEEAGRIKSAYAQVKKIQEQASRQRDEVTLIRCFFYESKYLQVVDENAKLKIIENLTAEIANASPASRAILMLVYAECLERYYNKNQGTINARTNVNESKPNFLTWTGQDFRNAIDQAYAATLADKVLLQQTKLSQYDALFDYFRTENFKKKTLYEYLAGVNISHYKLAFASLSNLERQNLDAGKLFGDTEAFLTLNPQINNDIYLKRTVQLYQELEGVAPTIDNQLDRLLFCYDRLIDDSDRFITSLDRIAKKNTDTLTLQKVQFQKASIYAHLASKETHPDYNQRAIAILDSIVAKNNHSNTYKQALLKRNEIADKQLTVTIPEFLYDRQHARALVQYKNVDTLKVSFYKTTLAAMKSSEYDNHERTVLVDSLVKFHQPAQSFVQVLPSHSDYFNHTTEVLLPELEIGSYLAFFACTNGKGERVVSFNNIIVSNLCVTTFQTADKTETFQVHDRKTGKPIENATLKGHLIDTKTDANGIATMQIDKNRGYNYYRTWIDVAKGNDSLFTMRDGYARVRNRYDPSNVFDGKIQLFTDRSIYRPGQTLYYKGIAIQQKGIQHSVVPNLGVTVTIKDPERNTIKTFETVTNEFGSFSGEFVLPKSGLTGRYTIAIEEPEDVEKAIGYDPIAKIHPFWDEIDWQESETDFSVEEYKRPKFEVNFEPVTQNYLFGQSATVVGKAKSFAGSAVSGAKVTYTIQTSTRRYRFASEKTVINGETTTDASGKFSIAFTPVFKDEEGDQSELPVYSYDITANVTDINGETRSDSQMVMAGFHTLQLNVQVPTLINTDEKTTLQLGSTNLNGQFVPTKGQLKIFLLREQEKQFQQNPWSKPEIEIISKADFTRLFPYEKPYAETPATKLMHSQSIDTQHKKTVELDFIGGYQSGAYKVVFIAKDEKGHDITTQADFQIQQSRDPYMTNQIVTIVQRNKNPEKDGFVELKFTSPVAQLYLQVAANYHNDNYFSKDVLLENHSALLRIPLHKHFEDQIKIGIETVFDNDHYSLQKDIKLVSQKPFLEWETESFRSKIEPGSAEKWSFRLTEKSASKNAEVLASMYDSSLDTFRLSRWDGLALDRNNGNWYASKSGLGFGNTNIYFSALNPKLPFINLRNESITLMWFGFEFGNNTAQLSKYYQTQLARKIGKPIHAKVISGIVTEGGLPIPGAVIWIKGTGRTTQSDFDGYYEMDAISGETIVFSLLGMQNKEIVIEATTRIDATLTYADSSQLEEVVVTSMGIKKEKKSLGYAVTTVNSEEFVAEADDDIFYAISGKAAGVMIDSTYGFNTKKIIIRGNSSISGMGEALVVVDGTIMSSADLGKIPASDLLSVSILKKSEATDLYGSAGINGVIIITTKRAIEALAQVKVRKNLQETAFFFPHLQTDKNGQLNFSFTAPEALTQWKMRLLAHDKNAASGTLDKTTVTQKDVMLLTNFPRFFREKDTIVIAAKIANMTDKPQSGIASLHFFDAVTMQNVDVALRNTNNVQNFTIQTGGNTALTWKIVLPEGIEGLQYRIVAQSGNFSDGEENIIPVLSNSLLVTESIPIWVRENSKKDYVFENFRNNTSPTLRHHQLTLEYTSNPAWTALQSLPYLMEYEHECAEQTFSRFYANALATQIIDSNPKVSAVLDSWRTDNVPDSKLEQNEELKAIILAETPWLRDAENQAQQKKNLSLLFDLAKMKQSQQATFQKLVQKQQPSGGFSWFDGGYENSYITRHIIAGFGHLKKLGVELPKDDSNMIENGIDFIDKNFLDEHQRRVDWLKRYPSGKWMNCFNELHYLYGRSFFLDDFELPSAVNEAAKIYLARIKVGWVDYSLYEKGLAALTLHRFGDTTTAKKILVSLQETASNNEDWGMYWIANQASYHWYQSPIETQALLIEAFGEIASDTKSVDAMKVWLLKMKQNKNWPTTKSTTEAVYALLLQGSDWLSVKDNTVIRIGNEKVLTKKITENEREAGTGYLKLNWKASEITPDLAKISIQNKTNVPAYGGLHWQYFESVDKIKNNSANPLLVEKELYLKQPGTQNAELNRITSQNQLKTGDLVTVRLVVTAKEDAEYVHLKDMRASCFEPVDVLSGYHWKGGLGYYQSTKDAATHLFFDSIRKGTYVLEYDIRVNNVGDFSNGITTIQSMYAPEFASHTKGIRVHVKP